MISFHTIIDLFFENIIYLTLFLVFITIIRNILNSYLERSRLPAGPTGLPIVGYLPFLGSAPHRKIAQLAKKYGNVFTVQLGVNNVVFLNDYDSVKEAFSKDQTLGKPHRSQFALGGTVKSFSDEEGSVWKEQRRQALQVFRDLGFGKGSMEEKITQEVHHLIEYIERSGGQSVDIRKLLTPSMSNNISQLVFGHRYEFEDPDRVLMDRLLDEASALFSSTSIFTTWPYFICKILLTIGAYSQNAMLERQFKIFDDEITNHEKTFDESVIRDYIDGFLAHIKNTKDKNTSFNRPILHANVLGFFGAGSETVRTTTEWCILAAAHYSDHQKRVQMEIDEIVGKERTVTWADRLRMPYTQAFICEVFRWKPTAPINLYRRTIDDIYVSKQLIPNDTLILANFWAVHNDPKLWTNPDQFDPTRFLTKDGKELTNTEYVIPFSIGKRSCPGETLARVEVFLYFATLLQKYTISPIDGQKISFEEKFGLSLQPKNKSLLEFTKRV